MVLIPVMAFYMELSTFICFPSLLSTPAGLYASQIEVRDSRTGYFIPARYGRGLLPDGKIVGAPPPPPSASPGNHLEKVTLTVLVFGPEWVSYERSRRVRHAKMREISARVFFVKISKSQDSMIYTIFSFFRIHIPKMDSFANVSVTRPGRPDHFSIDIYFQVPN